MIGRVSFPYGYLEKCSDLEYTELQSVISELPEDRNKVTYLSNGPYLCELEEVLKHCEEVTVKPASSNNYMVRLEKKVEILEREFKLNRTNFEHALKGVIQIHTPNLGLLNIRSVDVSQDSCTDEIQDKLKEGWRILAICPPNANRRPDYIMGHTEENKELWK